MHMNADAHPTGGKCKRCGKPLTRLALPSPTAGQMVAERWCSMPDDQCYEQELAALSKQTLTASRLRNAAGAGDAQRPRKEIDE